MSVIRMAGMKRILGYLIAAIAVTSLVLSLYGWAYVVRSERTQEYDEESGTMDEARWFRSRNEALLFIPARLVESKLTGVHIDPYWDTDEQP